MSYNLESNTPGLRIKTLPQRVWAVTGNTDVVLDANVNSNTVVQIMNTSAYTGPWWITSKIPGTGFTVTSGNSEQATTTTYTYLLE